MRANRDNADQIVRIPASVAGPYFDSDDFRFLGCAGQVTGNWVWDQNDNMFFEFYDLPPDVLKRLIDSIEKFAANRIAAR